MTHPLTDEMCELIADTEDRLFTSIEKSNMRAAYDKGFNDAIELITRMGLAPFGATIEAQENFYNQAKENN